MILYHLLSTLAAFAAVPLFATYSLLTGSKRRGLPHHFGLVPKEESTPNKKVLWMYALSLGEVTAAAPVLKLLHENHPDLRIVVSVTTDSGFDGAKQKIPFAQQILFHPLDCLPFTLNALNRIRPDVFVVADTGFWPGLLHVLRQRNIPALLFNGRISKRSLKRYRVFRPYARQLFENFDVLCMQSEQGKNAMTSLGLEPSRLAVIGDPKFDMLAPLAKEDRMKVRAELGIPERSPVWVAGSTHQGEEAIVLQAYQNLKKQFSDLVLILAPRRMERVKEVASLLQTGDIPFLQRTSLNKTVSQTNCVILLDTLGELSTIYSIADVAFVGKSLITPGGGHSLMEPVAQGVPVLHGPFIENFQHVAEELRKEDLALQVKNAEELETAICDFLKNPGKLERLTDKASALIQARQGASRKMADLILKKLGAL